VRFFLIFLVGIIITSLVGLSNFDNAFAQSETGVLTLDRFPSSGKVGELITFTGTLKLNKVSSEGAIVYIMDRDTQNTDDLLTTAYVESNGRYSANWIVANTDQDNDLEIYAVFEGNDVLKRLTTCDNESTTSDKEQCPNTIHFGISPSLPPPLSLIPKSEPPRPSETHMELYYSLDFDKTPLIGISISPDSFSEVRKDIRPVMEGIRKWELDLQNKFGGDWKINFDVIEPGIVFFKNKPDVIVNLKPSDSDDKCKKGTLGYAEIGLAKISELFRIKPINTVVCLEFGRSYEIVFGTAAHEFIHAMGLGHAFNSNEDLMCSSENGKPTCPDAKNMYNFPSDFNVVAIAELYGKDGFKNPNNKVVRENPFFTWSDYLNSGFANTAQPKPTPTPQPQPTTPQPQLPVYVSISTDKGTYQDGDTIVVTGKVYNFQKNLPSTLIMADPSNKLITISQFQLDDRGEFRILLPLSKIKMNSSGSYSLTLYHGVTSEKTYFSYTIPSEITQPIPTPTPTPQPTPTPTPTPQPTPTEDVKEKLEFSNLHIVDSFGNPTTNIAVGDKVKVSALIKNLQNREQSFAYLVQVQDTSGITKSTGWITGSLSPRQSFSPGWEWTPKAAGTYTVTAFLWKSANDPTNTSPLIQGCTIQKYSKVPASSKVTSKESPAMNSPLSNTPSGPSAAVPLVTV